MSWAPLLRLLDTVLFQIRTVLCSDPNELGVQIQIQIQMSWAPLLRLLDTVQFQIRTVLSSDPNELGTTPPFARYRPVSDPYCAVFRSK